MLCTIVGMFVCHAFSMGMGVIRFGPLAGHDVDFRARNAATAHLARFEPCAHIEVRNGFREQFKRDACIHKGAQQHVAADAGETLQISNSHAS